MKKRLLAFLLTAVLCLSLAIPCFAATLSENEAISRRRAYYPFVDESISKLYKLLPSARDAQIDKVFIYSTGDYVTQETIAAKRAESTADYYSAAVFIHLDNYNNDGEYVFFNALSNIDSYAFVKPSQSVFADSVTHDVTYLYNTFITALSEKKESAIGTGVYSFGSEESRFYLLDIDLNDYHNCNYYTGNQELVISGKTDFDYYYTYKDGANYKCFSIVQNGQRFYASVREELYDYYKDAFKNHSLTLKGKYQFTAGDGAAVVKISTLVEGTKETNLLSYLWELNKGTAKNPNFKAYADLNGDGLTISAAQDGLSITINSNPLGASQGSDAYKLSNDLALMYIQKLNSYLGLPDWLYTEMLKTRALDGRQKETFDYVTVTWSYHPDSGINILYRKNN